MRILLLNSSVRLSAPPTTIPTGLAQIAAYLRENGFPEVDMLDVNGLRLNKKEVLERIEEYDPDLLGISGLITTVKFQRDLVRDLRVRGFDKFVISGGGCATSVPGLMQKEGNIDILVIGEGEHTMLELARVLQKKGQLSTVDGIIYKNDDTYITNPSRKNEANLNRFPFPAYDLLPVDIYTKNHIWGDKNASNKYEGFDKCIIERDMNLISSRGCPFKCNYCYHIFGRGKYRFRSPQNIYKEVEFLRDEYEIDFISFVDDNMLVNRNRVIEFCNLMRNSGVKWGCLARVDEITEEYVKHLKAGGCVGIGFGLESGSPKILKNMNKKATPDQALRVFDLLRDHDIYVNGTFILGYPGENWDTVRETKDFCEQLDILQKFFFITPYPGTPLWAHASKLIEDEEGFIERLGDADEFLINLSELSDEELLRAKDFLESK
jgi:radical SAM superfamily enzyme YgiQ (UPF0313 family)